MSRNQQLQILTQEQIDTYRRDGVLVIPGLFTEDELTGVSEEFHKYLGEAMKIYHDDIKSSKGLSNARLAGIVDCFWQKWKMELNSNPKFYAAMQDLYDHTYASESAASDEKDLFYSPFGAVHRLEDGRSSLFYYIDRANYRIPNAVLPVKGLPIHVDCDPKFPFERTIKTEEDVKKACEIQKICLKYQDGATAFENADREAHSNALTDKRDLRWKWRPIQSFVALTDNPHGDLGGFMAIKGMFQKITSQECTSLLNYEKPNNEFTVLEHFPGIHDQIENIVYKRGDLVLWDWRTPHTNAASHLGSKPREVVYIQVMPDTLGNRVYASLQRRNYEDGYYVPVDFARMISYQETIVGAPWKPTTKIEQQLLGMEIPSDDITAILLDKGEKDMTSTSGSKDGSSWACLVQ
eukprot:TRINITY_DN21274_c0_g1_i1.p1 TRINITY_DN21274_c0_g1~~TRINITY_DN21274_c0_g1_i1.p1  ORF type:complete len:408 (-),score=93.86 TRINITY_DN21274_c0_g1_i1:22-1245(-)